jgi:2-dehydro-3-deoxyphosphogluconate aldolase/(4S)-4-hydroxy-2-oxoglutarate aldolase
MSTTPMMTQVLHKSRVIPVATIEDADHAQAIGESLLEGGVGVIEVTLRTRQALRAIERLRRDVPEMMVGAGTVWTAEDWVQAESAGAQFIVSPGAPVELVQSARLGRMPYLPGAQTATEVQALAAAGYDAVKFFPAAPAGGVAALKALSAVFPGMRFCPTGGISPDNASSYLSLACVPCVGGSWLLPAATLEAKEWSVVAALARLVSDEL